MTLRPYSKCKLELNSSDAKKFLSVFAFLALNSRTLDTPD